MYYVAGAYAVVGALLRPLKTLLDALQKGTMHRASRHTYGALEILRPITHFRLLLVDLKQRRIAVAQEAEVVVESVAIDVVPAVAYVGTHKQ